MTPKVQTEALEIGIRFMELVGVPLDHVGPFTVHCDGHGPRVVEIPEKPKKVEIDRAST